MNIFNSIFGPKEDPKPSRTLNEEIRNIVFTRVSEPSLKTRVYSRYDYTYKSIIFRVNTIISPHYPTANIFVNDVLVCDIYWNNEDFWEDDIISSECKQKIINLIHKLSNEIDNEREEFNNQQLIDKQNKVRLGCSEL